MLDALKARRLNLDDPAVTVQLLKLNAVVGRVIGKVVGANDNLATLASRARVALRLRRTECHEEMADDAARARCGNTHPTSTTEALRICSRFAPPRYVSGTSDNRNVR